MLEQDNQKFKLLGCPKINKLELWFFNEIDGFVNLDRNFRNEQEKSMHPLIANVFQHKKMAHEICSESIQIETGHNKVDWS